MGLVLAVVESTANLLDPYPGAAVELRNCLYFVASSRR
jgi:hypothetical protein